MPTETAKITHPAQALEAMAARQRPDHVRAALQDAATRLRRYELRHGVTFVALDKEALAEVKRQYAIVSVSNSRRDENVLFLVNALNDLLGLENS